MANFCKNFMSIGIVECLEWINYFTTLFDAFQNLNSHYCPDTEIPNAHAQFMFQGLE